MNAESVATLQSFASDGSAARAPDDASTEDDDDGDVDRFFSEVVGDDAPLPPRDGRPPATPVADRRASPPPPARAAGPRYGDEAYPLPNAR